MAVIPDNKVGDRFVGVFVAITLVCLAILVGLVIYLVVRVSDVAASNTQNVVSSCKQSNQNRVEDIAIWNRLLRLPPGASAAQKSQAAELEHLVKVKDMPHDCG